MNICIKFMVIYPVVVKIFHLLRHFIQTDWTFLWPHPCRGRVVWKNMLRCDETPVRLHELWPEPKCQDRHLMLSSFFNAPVYTETFITSALIYHLITTSSHFSFNFQHWSNPHYRSRCLPPCSAFITSEYPPPLWASGVLWGHQISLPL